MESVTLARILWARHASGTHLPANIPLIRTQLHYQNLIVKEPGKCTPLYAQKKKDIIEKEGRTVKSCDLPSLSLNSLTVL